MKKIIISTLIALLLFSCATTHQTETAINSTTTESFATTGTIKYNQIFGANGQINFNRYSYNDTNLQKAIDSLHLDAIRYPGGTIAEYFNYLTDTPSVYSMASLKRYTKIPTVFIVLNTKTSTLQNQLTWLTLCRSQGLFAQDPWFEIGNEFEEVHDDKFADKCATWANALKSQYPGAHLCVPGGAPSKWNQKILDRIPGVYLVDHYHNPSDYTRNGITDTVAIDSMMRADKRKFFPGVPTSRIVVTEFNLMTDDNTTPGFANDEQKALAVSYMFTWFKNHGFVAALFHNIAMAGGNGMIESDAKGSRRTSTGQGYINFKLKLK